MFRRLAELILNLKWIILAVLIAVTLVMGNAVRRLSIDPSLDALFSQNSPEYKTYIEFSRQFGSDHMIAVAMSTPDLFSVKYLKMMRELSDRLAKYPQVERVVSLTNAMDIQHKSFGIKIVPALQGVLEGDRPPEDAKKDILANELYQGNLVSRDGTVGTILVYMKLGVQESGAVDQFIRELRELLNYFEEPGLKFYLAGSPVEQYDFVQSIRRDQFIFIPIITAFLIITTWVMFKSFPCMILSMSIVFMTVIWSFGSIVFMKQDLNLVTSLLAPVIMIIAVVNSIHQMTLFFITRRYLPDFRESVLRTMSQLGAPAFLSHLTIILGFLALLLDPVPAIQSFGTFAALGTTYSYLVSTLLTPILLPILPYRPEKKHKRNPNMFTGRLGHFLEDLASRRKTRVLFATLLVVAFCFAGLRRLAVDTNLIKQLKPDTPLAVATHFIDDHLTGVYVLGFVLTKRDASPITDYESLERIDRFKDFLESNAAITKVNAITTLVKKINEARDGDSKSYLIPNDEGRLKRYFKGILESKDPELWKLVTRDLKKTRLEARMKAVGTKEGSRVEDSVREYMEKEMSPYFNYYLTGNVVLLGKMSKELVENQIKGFCFAFVSILLSICLAFRSLRIGLLVALPNLLPILCIYAIMGFAGIPISSPTAMVSSIVLGLVVDASIHFLYRFRLEFEHHRKYRDSLHHTYMRVGQSLFVSTLVLVIGFASSVFASFRPTIYFGVMTSLAIFFSLISSLVLLPGYVFVFKPFGRERIDRPEE